MNFSGWQPVSLVDYPKKISTVVFTSRCNFDCAYCHNPLLKQEQPQTITQQQIFAYMQKRRKQIDAVVVTGGEPSLFPENVIQFADDFHLAFPEKSVKIDTNASTPRFLEEGRGIFDFVAMDLKSLHYELFSTISFESILQSLQILRNYPNYEVRITLYPPYLPEKDFKPIALLLKDYAIQNVALQQYHRVKVLAPIFTDPLAPNSAYDCLPYSEEKIRIFADVLQKQGMTVSLRM